VNWSYIFFDQSYFVNISRPPMLQHLWSLAIEEQFYVIWPMVLILLTKTKLSMAKTRATIFLVALIGAIGSSLVIAYLSIKNGYPTPNDPSRVYFGTDTHSMGLLIGCAAAAVWSETRFKEQITPDRRSALNLFSLLPIAVIAYYIIRITEFDHGLYVYGFAIVSVASAVLIFLTTHPALLIGNLLSAKPIVWIGERSYGIYIWHWPIFMLLRPGIDNSWPENLNTLIRFVLVFVISDISYRFVELPIRKGAIGRTLAKWREIGIPKPTIPQLISSTLGAAIITTAFFGMYRAPVANAENLIGLGGITAIDQDPTSSPQPAPTQVSPEPVISLPADADAKAPSAQEIQRAANSTVVFGDSVVLSALTSLQSTLGDIAIDAEIARQPSAIAERIELRRKEQRLGNDVVIHMGTNGVVTRNDLEPILQSLSDRRRVVVVNVKVPRKWMKASNSMIAELAPLYPNVRIADWAATADGHRKYFGPDGVHLTKTGGQAFANLIKETLDAP
jgi:peptidoglycan/LPS O-acetylase OafA/YrhL